MNVLDLGDELLDHRRLPDSGLPANQRHPADPGAGLFQQSVETVQSIFSFDQTHIWNVPEGPVGYSPPPAPLPGVPWSYVRISRMCPLGSWK